MKILQKRVEIVYHFRCAECRSKFEMTEEEKVENEFKFSNYGYNRTHLGNKYLYFNCPICKCVRQIYDNDIHKISIMDDLTEILE